MAIEGRRLFANLEPILLEQGFNLKPASEAKYILRFDVFGISIREYKTATISCRLFRLTSEGQNFDPTSLWDAKILLPDAYAVNRPDDALRTLLAQFGKEIDKESVPVVRVGQ